MPNSTNNNYLKIRNRMKQIWINKYKILAMEIVILVSQFIQSNVFTAENYNYRDTSDEADSILFNLNIGLYFIMSIPVLMNMASRLDDGALSEEEFSHRLAHRILDDRIRQQDMQANCDRLHDFQWLQFSHNYYKIGWAGFILLADALSHYMIETDSIFANLLAMYIASSAGSQIIVADRLDAGTMTARAYIYRHNQNHHNRFFNNLFAAERRFEPNEELEPQLALHPLHHGI
jgi:hypothetical protein